MTEAKKILGMIETVDPKDTAKLDEIDNAVFRYFYLRPGMCIAIPQHPKYTRSRDVLKSIRPEGYAFEIQCWIFHDYDGGYNATYGQDCCHEGHICGHDSPKTLPTEELAELHAIIQAIEYERGKQ